MARSVDDGSTNTMFQMPRLASQTAAPTATAAEDRDRDPELNDHDNDGGRDEATHTLLARGGRAKPSIVLVYSYATLCAVFRTMYCIPIAGVAVYMLVPGPAQYQTVLPYAALTLVVAIIHIFFASYRTHSPASPSSALPSRLYLSALVVSPILLLASIGYGAAVLHLTKQYFNQYQDRVVRCVRRGRKWCRPKTREGVVYDCEAVAVAFAGLALLSSLAQCWFIYTLHRNRYSAVEIAHASDVMSPKTFTSVMRDAFGRWFGWGEKK